MSAGENSVISENNNNVEAEEVIDIEDVPDIVLHPPSSVLWFVTSPVWKVKSRDWLEGKNLLASP